MRKVVKAGEGRETAIEIELKGVAVEKATIFGQAVFIFLAASPLSRAPEKTAMLRATQARISPSTVIQDSLGFWISGCGFRIPGTGFRKVYDGHFFAAKKILSLTRGQRVFSCCHFCLLDAAGRKRRIFEFKDDTNYRQVQSLTISMRRTPFHGGQLLRCLLRRCNFNLG